MRLILSVLALVSSSALAQQVVNQGKPGTQGAWPVTCTNCSGGGSSDAGSSVSGVVAVDGGYLRANQGAGLDGGTGWGVWVENLFTPDGGVAAYQGGLWNVGQSGAWSVGQSGTWSVTATQPTGSNLHVVVDTAPTTAVTGPLTDAQLRATPVPVSGTVTVNNASVGATGSAPPSSATLSGGSVTTAAPSYTNGQMSALSLTTGGALRTDSSSSTQPVSGTVAATQSGTWTIQPGNTPNTTPWLTRPSDGTNSANIKAASTAAIATDPALVVAVSPNNTVAVSGTVTANAGTNLNTSALALDATLGRAIASTTSGQTGPLVQGAVTTAAPAYTTAQTNPLSLTTAGSLRVVNNATVAQASTTSGAVGELVQGAVTTAAPSYTTAQTNPLSLTTAGSLRTVDNSTVAQGSTTSGQVGGLTLGAVTTAAPTYTTAQSNPLSLATTGHLRTLDLASSATGSNASANAVQIGMVQSGASTLRVPTIFDLDNGAGTQFVQGVNLRAQSSGGSVEMGADALVPGLVGSTGLFTREIWKTQVGITNTAVSCGTTATLAPTTVRTNRTTLCLFNVGSATIYIGGSAVTTANGFPILQNTSWCDNVLVSAYYCIVAAATQELRVMEN